MFFIDRDGRLLRDVVTSEGTVASVVMPIKAIVRQAFALSATSILVAHNHPSGYLAPSLPDRGATAELGRQLRARGIALIEHLVVTRTGCTGILATPHTAPGSHQ